MNIADQIQHVRLNIDQACVESGREALQVRLLGVSKTHPASVIQDACRSGITEFGESYLQEALSKIEQCRDLPISWHFIGPIQSNKTRPIAENFDWVQSVDRVKILSRLNDQRPTGLAPLQVCIQANLFGEAQKKGVGLVELPDLLAIADKLPNIDLRGIMVIPPKQASHEAQLIQFKEVANIYAKFKQDFPSMDTLSMGMSNDLRAAIYSGSNMIRIGTGIFGPRGTNHQ